MAAPRPPIPPEDFVLPNQRIISEAGEASRESTESLRPLQSSQGSPKSASQPVKGLARHTLGIILLLVTVVLWTASNFLGSDIFADGSYTKPYFVTYVNSSFFTLFLVPVVVKRLWASGGSIKGALRDEGTAADYTPIVGDEELAKPDEEAVSQQSRQLLVDDTLVNSGLTKETATDRLNLRDTAWLSFEFCILWFLANYCVAACLEYTTVASSTILTSTSSIFTLLLGAWLAVERFTVRKLVGVLASLTGIILISSVDLTGNNDKNRGSFPHKSHLQLFTGDALALASALLYGVYTSLMKKRIGDESRVDMTLFFGFVGLFNILTLLPGFPVLHFLGVEKFELPPTKRILAIVLINSATSLVSDFCWAYSMLLTSPLVTTVGLSLSIPLSLFGQMILNNQMSSVLYWVGAGIVLLSFVFINYESKEDEGVGGALKPADGEDRDGRIKQFFQNIWDRISQRRT